MCLRLDGHRLATPFHRGRGGGGKGREGKREGKGRTRGDRRWGRPGVISVCSPVSLVFHRFSEHFRNTPQWLVPQSLGDVCGRKENRGTGGRGHVFSWPVEPTPLSCCCRGERSVSHTSCTAAAEPGGVCKAPSSPRPRHACCGVQAFPFLPTCPLLCR